MREKQERIIIGKTYKNITVLRGGWQKAKKEEKQKEQKP